MQRMPHTTKLAGLAIVATMLAGSAAATSLDNVYVFGDSLSDVGNLYTVTAGATPVSPPYDNGRFSNGPVWIENLAQRRHLGTVTPSVTGGDDYAVGGAQTGATPAHDFAPIDLPAQIASYDLNNRPVDPNALYTLWIGANDVNALASGILKGDLARSDAAGDIAEATDHVANAVNGLAAHGMRNLLALNVPDLSKTPNAIAAANQSADPGAVLGLYSALSKAYNTSLERTLQQNTSADGVDLNLVDTFSVINRIVANPQAFGFDNATDPCWTGNFLSAGSGSVCSDPDSHLFWDGLHPTAHGHRLVADYAEAALTSHPVPAPGGLGLAILGLIVMGILGILGVRRRGRTFGVAA